MSAVNDAGTALGAEVSATHGAPRDQWFAWIGHLATLSTGEHVANPGALAQHLARLKCLQQRLARQQRGSNRRRGTRMRIARVHARIRNTRCPYSEFLLRVSCRHGSSAIS